MKKILKRLLFIIPLLFCAATAHATCTSPCVQSAPDGSNSGVANISFTFSSNVTNGNTIYIWACWNDATATFTSFTKGSGSSSVGTFNVVGSTVTSGNFHCNQGWVAVTGTGTLTVTATLSSAASGILISDGTEFTGIITGSPVDVSGMNAQSNPGLGSNALTSCSSTCNSTQNGDVISGFNDDLNGNVTTIAAGTGFTAINTGTSNYQQEYQSQATAGSAAATFTWQTTGGGDTGITGMIAFKTTMSSAAPAAGIGGKAGIGGTAGIGL